MFEWMLKKKSVGRDWRRQNYSPGSKFRPGFLRLKCREKSKVPKKVSGFVEKLPAAEEVYGYRRLQPPCVCWLGRLQVHVNQHPVLCCQHYSQDSRLQVNQRRKSDFWDSRRAVHFLPELSGLLPWSNETNLYYNSSLFYRIFWRGDISAICKVFQKAFTLNVVLSLQQQSSLNTADREDVSVASGAQLQLKQRSCGTREKLEVADVTVIMGNGFLSFLCPFAVL